MARRAANAAARCRVRPPRDASAVDDRFPPRGPLPAGSRAARTPRAARESDIEPSTSRPQRILILSADLGEGHDAAARALAAGLVEERPDIEATVADGLAALGPFLRRLIRDGSWFQFRRLPWVFGIVYALLMGFPPVRRGAHGFLYRVGGRGLMRLIESRSPDVVVSTYPGINPVLGRLRRSERLRAVVCTTVLDLASLEFWAHPGIDLHLVMHPGSTWRIEELAGPGRSAQVRPLVAPSFLESRERRDARRSLALPEDGETVLVTGGGWGIGDLEGAVAGALEAEVAAVVCVAGRNEEVRARLERRFAADPRVRVLGFTDRMRDLIAAADVLVHSAGGVTCLEGLVTGCPTVLYGMPPGHWRANARGMASLGLARLASSRTELPRELKAALAGPTAPPLDRSREGAAALVLAAEASANGRGRAGRLAVGGRLRGLGVTGRRDRRRMGENGRASGQERHPAQQNGAGERSRLPALADQRARERDGDEDVHHEHDRRHASGGRALEGAHLAQQADSRSGGRGEDPQHGHAPVAAARGVREQLGGDPAPRVGQSRPEHHGYAGSAPEAAEHVGNEGGATQEPERKRDGERVGAGEGVGGRREREHDEADADRAHRGNLADADPLVQHSRPDDEQEHEAHRQNGLDHGEGGEGQGNRLESPPKGHEQRAEHPATPCSEAREQGGPQGVVTRSLARVERLNGDTAVVERRGEHGHKDAEQDRAHR